MSSNEINKQLNVETSSDNLTDNGQHCNEDNDDDARNALPSQQSKVPVVVVVEKNSVIQSHYNGLRNMGFEDEVKKSPPEYTELTETARNIEHGLENGHAANAVKDADLGDGDKKLTTTTDDMSDDSSSTEERLDLVKRQISTTRHVLNQEQFDDIYEAGDRPKVSPKEYVKSVKDGCECNSRCVKKKIMGVLPCIKIFKNYSIKEDLLMDAVAGLTVGVMQIPQGMAYALLASLPPEYGLYTSLFPVLLYFVFGTSRHVSVGTFAVVSLMVGTTVDKYCFEDVGGGDSVTTALPFTTIGWENVTRNSTGGSEALKECKVAVATAVTFLGGIIQLIMCLFRLGFVTMYLSEAMTRGFTTGCAIHVFSSQIKYVFGVSVGRYAGPWKLIYTYRDLFLALPDTQVAAVVLSLICIVIIYLTKEYLNPIVKKRIKAPIPIDLIVVILGTVASALADFNGKWGIQVVGDIPTGIPPPQFPPVDRFADVFADSIAIAIVAFAISVSMVQLFARKHNYETDSNQELLAHGISNSICSTLNCYMMCVSLSRSVVQEAIGCKSQITALFNSVLIGVVVIFLAQYFEQLPNCVLAAIIIVALKGMFMQFKDIPKYWKISGTDLSVWIVTFVAVVLLDVGYGLIVGVCYSLLTVVGRTQRPYSGVEGRIPDSDIYKDAGVYGKADEMKGVKIFRFDGPIYFANSSYFVDQVYEKTECDAKRITLRRAKVQAKKDKEMKRLKKLEEKSGAPSEDALAKLEEAHEFQLPTPHIHHVVLDCTTISYVDAMGVQVLRQVCSEYKDVNVIVFLAGCKAGIREMLVAGGFHDRFDKDILFPTVHDAVIASVADDPHLISELEMIIPGELNTEL